MCDMLLSAQNPVSGDWVGPDLFTRVVRCSADHPVPLLSPYLGGTCCGLHLAGSCLDNSCHRSGRFKVGNDQVRGLLVIILTYVCG